MNISNEKEYLYKLMQSLLEERRIITEELLIIRKRINKLDDFQEIGINDIPAVDYIRLKNSINNAKYELSRDRIKSGHDAYKQSMQEAPPNDDSTYEEEQKESWKDITPVVEEERPIIKEPSTAKRKSPSFERVMSIVIQLLKDSGGPVHIRDIRSTVEDRADYKFAGNRFSTHLWRIKNENEKVTQPARGYYQYRV